LLAGWAFECGVEARAVAETETRRALDKWIDMGLGVRSKEGERHFDPVEVVNFLKLASLDGRDAFWRDRYVPTGRRLVTDLAAQDAEEFQVDYRRTFNVRDLTRDVRLRVPLPLTGACLSDLAIEPIGDTSTSRTILTAGRLDARVNTNSCDQVVLGARSTFKSQPWTPDCKAERLTSSEEVLYVRPREGLIVVTERIHALSRTLASDAGTELAAAKSFWDYMADEMMCGAIPYEQVTAASPSDWVLDTGWFDCQLGSALFVALCRARGIPSRVVGGHVLYERAPTNHYWAEIWIAGQGWTPFDFLSWDLSFGGRDATWRNHFFGHLDARMTTQRFPLEFTGAIGVPMPPAWTLLQAERGAGIRISLASLDGTVVYTDDVCLRNQSTNAAPLPPVTVSVPGANP
jgi:Transglutaminase-like superfamily